MSSLLFFLLTVGGLQAQETFYHAIGTEGYETGNAVKLLQDGGFILAGNTESYGLKYTSMLMIRTDSKGKVSWSKSYGSPHREIVSDVIQTDDGGFIVVGEKYQLNRNQGEFLTIFRTDRSGNLIWKKLYDEGGNETEGFSIAPTFDGNYIITGLVKNIPAYSSAFLSVDDEQRRAYIIKIDGNGNTIWSRSINTPSGGYASTGLSVIAASDNSIVVVGNVLSKQEALAYAEGEIKSDDPAAGAMGVLLTKLQADGVVKWTMQYGSNQVASGARVIEKRDGGFLIVGMCTPERAENVDVLAISLDVAGKVQWAKTYGGEGYDSGEDVVQTPDGGFIMSGESRSFGSAIGDVIAFRIDNTGNVKWAKKVSGTTGGTGGRLELQSNSVILTGGILLGKESSDVILAKLDLEGTSKCWGTDISIRSRNFVVAQKTLTGMVTQGVAQPALPPNFKKAEIGDMEEEIRKVRIMKICN